MLLSSSSSPTKRGASPANRKRVVCATKENGKLQCAVVDTKDMEKTEFQKKHLERKKKNCEMQEELGLGVCDADGDMNFFEEDAPTVHEEIDTNGNLIRFMILDPKRVVEMNKTEFKNFKTVKREALKGDQANFMDPDVKKAIFDLVGFEVKNAHPDKLKLAYISTPDEVKRRNTFRRYLACLVNEDNTTQFGNFSANLGINLQALSKTLLMTNLISKVVEALKAAKNDPTARSIAFDELRIVGAGGDGSIVFRLEDGYYFRHAVWEYEEGESVKVKLPEPLAEKLAEKLAMAELRKAVNSRDAVEIRTWIRLLLKNGSLVGSEISNSILGALLLDGGMLPADFGLDESACNIILNEEVARRAVVFNTVGKYRPSIGSRQIGKGITYFTRNTEPDWEFLLTNNLSAEDARAAVGIVTGLIGAGGPAVAKAAVEAALDAAPLNLSQKVRDATTRDRIYAAVLSGVNRARQQREDQRAAVPALQAARNVETAAQTAYFEARDANPQDRAVLERTRAAYNAANIEVRRLEREAGISAGGEIPR